MALNLREWGASGKGVPHLSRGLPDLLPKLFEDRSRPLGIGSCCRGEIIIVRRLLITPVMILASEDPVVPPTLDPIPHLRRSEEMRSEERRVGKVWRCKQGENTVHR